MTLEQRIREWCEEHGRTWQVGKPSSIGYRDLSRALGESSWQVRKAMNGMRAAGTVTPLSESEEHWLRHENKELRRKLDKALSSRAEEEHRDAWVEEAQRSPVEIPEWTIRPRRSLDRHEVIPTLSMSDWHGDELVRPEEVQYKNGYNREITTARMRTCFENTVKVAHEYFQGFRYPGITVLGLGDQLSGNIHEELRNNNADVALASVLYWTGPWVAGLRMLADAFGRVWVPWLVGNHGRQTAKPIFKRRAKDNLDWLLGKMIERELAGDKRITFAIAEGAKLVYSLYSTRYIATHGDECRGGSGITGMITPLMLADARMRKTFEYDVWCLGHWHQLLPLPNIRVNGSGKGFDEFALGLNFPFQKPLQDFWLTDPKHGVIASMPIHVLGDDEPWMRPAAERTKEAFQVMEAA